MLFYIIYFYFYLIMIIQLFNDLFNTQQSVKCYTTVGPNRTLSEKLVGL